MGATVGIKLEIDGYKDYKKQLNDLIQQGKTYDSELKKVQSTFTKETTAEEKNAKTKTIIAKQLENSKKQQELLNKVVGEATKKYGEDSREVNSWKEALNNAETNVNKLAQTQSNAVDEVEDFGNAMGGAKKQASTFSQVLKANLLSKAIIEGFKKLADLAKKIAGFFKDSVKDAANYADTILTLSSNTGVSVGNLQEFQYMTNLVDVSVEDMSQALKKTTQNMQAYTKDSAAMTAAEEQAAKTSNKRKKAQILAKVTLSETTQLYQQLGVALRDSNGQLRKADDIFWDTVSALRKIPNETDRNTVAMKLLGENASKVYPLLDKSAEELAALRKEAHDTGYVLDDDMLGTLGSLNDSFERWDLMVQSVKNHLGAALAPVIERIVKAATEFIKNVDWDSVSEMIVNGGQKLIEVLSSIYKNLTGGGWEQAKRTFSDLSSLVGSLATVFGFLGNIINISINMLRAIGNVVIQVGVFFVNLGKNIGYAAQAVVAWAKTVPSKVQSVVKSVGTAMSNGIAAAGRFVASIVSSVSKFGISVANGFKSGFNSVVNAVSNLWSTVRQAFSNLINSAANWGRDLIQGFINGIKAKFEAFKNAIKNIANTVKSYLHFSRPDVGPLRDYESWMPDMLKGMASSIKKSSYILNDAVAGVSAGAAAAMNYGGTTVNMTVNGAAGQSVDAIANAVMRKMYSATKQRGFSV